MAQRRHRQIMLLITRTTRPRRSCRRWAVVSAAARAEARRVSLPARTAAPKKRRSTDFRYESGNAAVTVSGAGDNTHYVPHKLKHRMRLLHRVTLQCQAATKARQMVLPGNETNLEDARDGGKHRLGPTAMSPRCWLVSTEIRLSDNGGRRVTGMLRWQKH